jgi:hypothetical protein
VFSTFFSYFLLFSFTKSRALNPLLTIFFYSAKVKPVETVTAFDPFTVVQILDQAGGIAAR